MGKGQPFWNCFFSNFVCRSFNISFKWCFFSSDRYCTNCWLCFSLLGHCSYIQNFIDMVPRGIIVFVMYLMPERATTFEFQFWRLLLFIEACCIALSNYNNTSQFIIYNVSFYIWYASFDCCRYQNHHIGEFLIIMAYQFLNMFPSNMWNFQLVM